MIDNDMDWGVLKDLNDEFSYISPFHSGWSTADARHDDFADMVSKQMCFECFQTPSQIVHMCSMPVFFLDDNIVNYSGCTIGKSNFGTESDIAFKKKVYKN